MTVKVYRQNLNKVWGDCFTIRRYQDLSFNIKDGLVNLAVDGNNDIKGVLTSCTKYYFISVRNDKLPYDLKRLVFKNNMTPESPTNILTLSLEDFNYLAYGVQMLKPDGINSFIIINKNDIFSFIGLYKKAKKSFKFNMDFWISEFEEGDGLFDVASGDYIETSIDYDKIFRLDDFTRKEFFKMCKACGLNSSNRKLLKAISKKSGGRSFSVYIEDLEEAIQEAEGIEKDLLQLKLIRLTEEDNSWNNLEVNINDYWYY